MKLSRPSHLLIPVETLNREFDGKLLLALAAAERGWQPIVGGRTAIHDRLASMPRSVYVAKGARSGGRLVFSAMENMGHIIVAFDEEALVRFSDEVFLMRLNPKTFGRVRLLFAWGDNNAQIWRRSQHYRGQPIVEAGNPRADMLRPELRRYFNDEIESIKARFGDFVLINSNFGLVNHFIANHTRFTVAPGSSPEKTTHYRDGLHAHKRLLFEAFLAMLPQLSAALRPYNIVIRPHPSENPEVWHLAAAGLDNVHVVQEASVVPWLAAARTLVHNGCTSAVEAAVIGTPSFAFRPFVSEEFDLELPNRFSGQCFSSEELAAQLCSVMSAPRSANRPLNMEQDALLHSLIASVEGKLTCERILDGLDEHEVLLRPAPWASKRRWLLSYLRLKRRALGRLVRTRLKSNPSSKVYTAHKFPGISLTEVNQRIARFQKVLGRFSGLQARQISRDIFAIEKN